MSEKILLKIAHYRTAEIDKAEMDAVLEHLYDLGIRETGQRLVEMMFRTTQKEAYDDHRDSFSDKWVISFWQLCRDRFLRITSEEVSALTGCDLRTSLDA